MLGHPTLAAAAFLLPLVLLLTQLPKFQLDASSDSIVLENDADLKFYTETRQVFGSDDYVFVALTPQRPLFERATLAALDELDKQLEAVPGVDSALSLLDAPLFLSPNPGLLRLADGYRSLRDPDLDLEVARTELLQSPLFSDALLSADGATTAVQVTFARDLALETLEEQRYELWARRQSGALTSTQGRELTRLDAAIRARKQDLSAQRRQQIAQIRSITEQHAELGEIELGGVPMITVDIVDFIESDIVTFGIVVLLFVVVMMAVLFRSLKWIVLPTIVCALVVLGMMGLLGLLEWHTTIVTSNFTSLLLIITVAMVIHVIVRFRELQARHPDADNRELMAATAVRVARPCFYTGLTTIVGFGSLYVSRIRPVMDLAMMMAIGILAAFAATFLLLPALNMFFGKGAQPPPRLADLAQRSPFTVVGEWAIDHRVAVTLGALVVLVAGVVGLLRLDVENRFIDYFHDDSQIYRGMVFIDERLGGTTPLEVVLQHSDENAFLQMENIERLRAIHEWLDEQPEIGKVLSLASLVATLEGILASDPNPLMRQARVNTQMLGMLRSRIPQDLADAALSPYVSDDFRQARISMRVRESDRGLRRKELLSRISDYLGAPDDDAAATPDEPTAIRARPTGMFVLYNNMLQSLFRSQIQTIAAVFGAIWLTFAVLFRSARVATVAIVPNVLPVVAVLGALGWLGIPLDMMTIMTAAVTLGIAVDDTIHFLHRFRSEIEDGRSYREANLRSLNSVGRAMFFTSVTIVAGFSVLSLSRFLPTVYFGIFTSIAMIMALLAAVTVLPLLVQLVRPFGPERTTPA